MNDRHPVAGDQVQAPAVHVEEVGIARLRSIGSVQAHDVETLIFNPDAAEEAALAGLLFRRDVEHEAAHVAEEFAASVVEVIVLAVEVGAVGVDHPREAHGLVLDLVELLEAAEQAGLHALFFFLQIVLAIDAFRPYPGGRGNSDPRWARGRVADRQSDSADRSRPPACGSRAP